MHCVKKQRSAIRIWKHVCQLQMHCICHQPFRATDDLDASQIVCFSPPPSPSPRPWERKGKTGNATPGTFFVIVSKLVNRQWFERLLDSFWNHVGCVIYIYLYCLFRSCLECYTSVASFQQLLRFHVGHQVIWGYLMLGSIVNVLSASEGFVALLGTWCLLRLVDDHQPDKETPIQTYC